MQFPSFNQDGYSAQKPMNEHDLKQQMIKLNQSLIQASPEAMTYEELQR